VSENIFKWLFYSFLIVVFILGLILFKEEVSSFFSGNKTTGKSDLLSMKAVNLLKTSPDSAIMYVDSALILSEKYKLNDTTLFLLYKTKAEASLQKNQPDSAFSNLKLALQIATEKSDTSRMAKASFLIGKVNYVSGKYITASKYLLDAVNLYSSLNEPYARGMVLALYGSTLICNEDYENAEQYLLESLKILTTLDSLKATSGVCIEIGSVFNAIGSEEEALYYYQMALKSAVENKDTGNYLAALQNIGIVYRTKYPDSSIYYYNMAFKTGLKYKGEQSTILTRYNMANIFVDKEDYSKAREIYDEVLELCLKYNVTGGMIRIYSAYSFLYEKKGEYHAAQIYLKRAMELADSTGQTGLFLPLKNQLYWLNKQMGNHSYALQLLEQIKQEEDSTKDINKQIAIHELENLFAVERKEKENFRLTQVIAVQEQKIGFRQILLFMMVIFSSALSVLLWKGYRLYLERGKAYDVLMEKYRDESEKRISTPGERTPLPNEGKSIKQVTEITDLFRQLIDYFQTNKPWLNPELRVEFIARELSSSPKAIASILKQNNFNFTTFTNQFRVEEAKRLMKNPAYKNYKIEAIASEAGFGAKRSFYNSFEQFTGIKPSFFRNYMQQQPIKAEENDGMAE